jgi:integrase
MSIHSRRLQSGKTNYDVRLRAPDGRQIKRTFRTKKDAERFLVQERSAILKGLWIDPNAGKVRLDRYSKQWLAQRTNLRPRTRELYEYLLRLHVLPELGSVTIDKLSPMMIRAWHARLHNEHNVSATTASKAYRLLRSMLSTAFDDELIARNPCVLKGAGVERSAERPTLSVAEVESLVNAVAPRYQAMALLATWAGLRYGEAAGLRRADIDLVAGTVRVDRQLQELAQGVLVEGPPKTDAGRRLVALPPHIEAQLAWHLDTFVESDPTSIVFTSPEGTPLRRSNFNRRVWQPACAEVGLSGFRFHDLRHTGNTFAAATGASTKELMSRMGHASSRAALIYQHATNERDRALADALSRLAAPSSDTAPKLRLVRDPESECAINAPSTGKSTPLGRGQRGIRPDQRGGDDGAVFEPPRSAQNPGSWPPRFRSIRLSGSQESQEPKAERS